MVQLTYSRRIENRFSESFNNMVNDELVIVVETSNYKIAEKVADTYLEMLEGEQVFLIKKEQYNGGGYHELIVADNYLFTECGY